MTMKAKRPSSTAGTMEAYRGMRLSPRPSVLGSGPVVGMFSMGSGRYSDGKVVKLNRGSDGSREDSGVLEEFRRFESTRRGKYIRTKNVHIQTCEQNCCNNIILVFWFIWFFPQFLSNMFNCWQFSTTSHLSNHTLATNCTCFHGVDGCDIVRFLLIRLA